MDLSKRANFGMQCFIISWTGQHGNARFIAKSIAKKINDLTVVYSDKSGFDEDGEGKWIKVPDEWFYGWKFKKCLDEIQDGNEMLLIHADAFCLDWGNLVDRFVKFSNLNKDLGVWAPDVDGTPWKNSYVTIAEDSENKISFVLQTDGIVFGLNSRVVSRLKKANFENNNYGWGIDWMSICFSYVNNLYVVRDKEIFINHKVGSGYGYESAAVQMNNFLEQMDLKEKIMFRLLSGFDINRNLSKT